MLRGLVALLVCANLAFFAWTQGWLDNVIGVPASGEREPERLANQVHPETIVILPMAASAAAAFPAPAAPSCMEAGPFNPAEVAPAEAALRGTVADGTWSNVRTEKPGTWVVYLGSYPSREALLRNEVEIRRIQQSFEEISIPAEGPFGLALGRFDDRAPAERALTQALQRGVRGARVVQLSAPTEDTVLRIERVDPALAARLAALKSDALGKGFIACGQGNAAR